MEYVAATSAYASLPQEVMAQLGLPKAPPYPPCLEAFDSMERWGFPNPGTWMDQPVDWMEDVQAAELGRLRSRRKNTRPKTSAVFANAPTGETL